MQASSIKLFMAGWLLLCSVSPLQSDPQRSYMGNYDVYDSVNHRSPSINPALYRVQYSGPNIPSPLTTQYNYQPVYPQNSWTPTKYASPATDQWPEIQQSESKHLPQQETYHNYRDLTRDNKKPESLNQEHAKFQQLGDRDAESNSMDEEIIEKMNILDKLLSDDSSEKDLETNMIEDKIIPEETKRVVRQVRKERPGFFWTLARITFETINDTRSAIKQISEIINNNISPDSATQSSVTSAALTAAGGPTGQSGMSSGNASETTTMRPTTTTEENFVLTRTGLQSLIRRNILGLVRLFNIEWRDALNQSETSVRQFQKELGNQVGSFLQDNPDAY